MKSSIFLNSKPGSRGRRQSRRLDDNAVARTMVKKTELEHQLKFMSRKERFHAMLALQS